MAIKKEITTNIVIPEGIQVEIKGFDVVMKGPKGELTRALRSKAVKLALENNNIKVSSAQKNTKREKRMINTFTAHIRNMIIGVNEGIIYKLKICSAHFPMNVTCNNKEFSVKNFLGEKIPRVLKLKEGVKVKIDGHDVTVNGIDLELVSQTAGSIEQLTRITNKDRRIFQDGIYITDKNGKEM